jgi:hypothetical protein
MWTKPNEVNAPANRLSNLQVIHEGQAGEAALAKGTWDGAPNQFLIRWNGTDENIAGYPLLSGQPSWDILPAHLIELIRDQDQEEIKVGDTVYSPVFSYLTFIVVRIDVFEELGNVKGAKVNYQDKKGKIHTKVLPYGALSKKGPLVGPQETTQIDD